MKNPEKVPGDLKQKLSQTGLWDIEPINLFRINWKNEPIPKGGKFGNVKFIEFPQSLTGAPARIIALGGKWFLTGAHKVGAA